MNRFLKNGTANFGPTGPTEICGLPPGVNSNIPVGIKPKWTYNSIMKTSSVFMWRHCGMVSEVMDDGFPLFF